jgi:PAT family beta-lactamase induction signal transducer AmpG
MAPGNTRRLLVALNLMAGLSFGIFFEAMPTYMRVIHCSLADIGLISLTQLPWSLKILWSPFIDRYGRLDRWLRAIHLSLAGIFVVLAWRHTTNSPHHMIPVMAALALASAMQDTIGDASFVHLVQGSSSAAQAAAGSLRISAYKVALMGGGGAAIVLGSVWGWAPAFLLVALTYTVSALFLPQHLRSLKAQPPMALSAWGQSLWTWLSQPGSWGTFGYILVYKLALATLNPMAKPYWVDQGVQQAWLGIICASLGLVGTVGGAIFAGFAAGSRGVVVALMTGTAAECVACLSYAAAVHVPYSPFILGFCVLAESMAQGIATAALVLLLTRICDQRQAATQFAALTATFAVTRALGGTLGGILAERIGYVLFFTLLPVTCLWSLLLLAPVRRRLAVAATPLPEELIKQNPAPHWGTGGR